MTEPGETRIWNVSFYSDREATVPIDTIDLGEVWDSDTTEGVIYMRNDEPHYAYEITINAREPEVTAEGPSELAPGEVAPLKVRWAPRLGGMLSLKSGLGVCAVLVMRIQ
ncbi:unnamed protein product [marine sediment metagenome]|uniref:Uncharacterized protein n=1 Tax=marine sediment metagenome TaxID=412755 RepID=X1TML5_9ZZZZ